jgi:hypothetical protein
MEFRLSRNRRGALIFPWYDRRDRVFTRLASWLLRLTSKRCRLELEATQLMILTVPAELLR